MMPRIKRPPSRPVIIGLLSAVALVGAACASSTAGARKEATVKTGAPQQQKPVKLRYYGGPKSPMYPE